MNGSDADRLAALETAVTALTQTVRSLQLVADRVSDIPAPDSPAQRKERADHVRLMVDLDVKAQARDSARASASARAEAEHALQLMARIEADPHVQTSQQRLDHLETSRPIDVSAIDWARDKQQPETGCCGYCCPSSHHDHSSRSTWNPQTLAAQWAQIRTHHEESL